MKQSPSKPIGQHRSRSRARRALRRAVSISHLVAMFVMLAWTTLASSAIAEVWVGDAIRTQMPRTPWGLAVGHLNEDSFLDVVVGCDNSLYVLINDGTGLFQVLDEVASNEAGEYVAIGDLNSDGTNDVAVTDHLGNKCRVFWNDGGGKLVSSMTISIPSSYNTERICIGDLDLDGHDELIVACWGRAYLYWGTGSGIDVQQPITLGYSLNPNPFDCNEFTVPSKVRLVDLSDSGHPDVVFSINWEDFPCTQFGERGIARFRNFGDRDIAPVSWIVREEMSGGASQLEFAGFDTADLDVNESLDFGVLHGEVGLRSFLNTAPGVWTEGPTTEEGILAYHMAFWDPDEDGTTDVATSLTAIRIRSGDGAGLFPEEVEFLIESMRELEAAELDGQPGVDLIGLDRANNTVTVLPNIIAPNPASTSELQARAMSSLVVTPTVMGPGGCEIRWRRDGFADVDPIVRVWNTLGRLVTRIRLSREGEAWVGRWDGTDASGPVASGSYFIGGEGSQRERVVLIR